MVSFRFVLGLVFLTTNQVIGWAGMAAGVYLAKRYSRKFFYLLGVVIYGLSWVMLALGAYLAGPEGMAWAKHFFWRFRRESIILGLLLVFLVIGYFRYRHEVSNKSKTS